MDLYGWDTEYAVSIDIVNKQLEKEQNDLITEFHFTLDGSLSYVANGKFGPWKIVQGGGGQLLNLEIPVTEGSFTMNAPQENVDLSGITFVFEMSLQLLPSATNPNQKDLSFNFSKAADSNPSGELGLLVPITVIDPQNKLNPITKAALPMLMAKYLVVESSLIAYIFASVNLVKPGAGGWLDPVQADYAILNKIGSPSGYLAILAVTDNRDISNYPRAIDPSIISGQSNAGFLISQDLFLKNVIMPQLPSIYKNGTTAATFRFDPDHKIRNNLPFLLTKVKNGAIWYDPVCASLVMAIQGNLITTQILGVCGLKMGMNMEFGMDGQNPILYDKGAQTFTFGPDSNPHFSDKPHIPWYDYLMGPIPDIIISAVIPSIARDITSQLSNNLFSFTIADMSPTTVHWQGMGDINVTNAGLNGCFFMVGTV